MDARSCAILAPLPQGIPRSRGHGRPSILDAMPAPQESELTRLLRGLAEGGPGDAGKLLPLVYAELRALAGAHMAREKPGRTLQATDLVHEAWLRVAGGAAPHWNSRAHFFGAAAQAMRRILVEQARRRARLKRGGG